MRKTRIFIAFYALVCVACKKQSDLQQNEASFSLARKELAMQTLASPGTYINNSSTDVAGLLNSYDSSNPNIPNIVTPSIYQINSIYHLFGMKRDADQNFVALKHYTSTDLTSWTEQSDLLSVNTPVTDARPGHSGTVNLLATSGNGRPNLLIQAAAGPQKYILSYKRAVTEGAPGRNELAIFTSASLTGPYVYSNVIRSIDWMNGSTPDVSNGLGGMSMYQEPGNGAAYFLTTFDVPSGTNHGTSIRRFDMATLSLTGSVSNASDYRQAVDIGGNQEAPRVFKRNGYYYWATSKTAGWNSSTTQYRAKTGTALLDNVAFAAIKTMPLSPALTTSPGQDSFDTQHSCIIPINNTISGTEFIYFGDRWTGYKNSDGSLSNHTFGGHTGVYPMIFLDNGANAPIPVICAPGLDYNGGDWVPNTNNGTWDVTNTVQDGDFEANFATYWLTAGTTGIASVSAGGRASSNALIVDGTATATTTVNSIKAIQLPTGTYSIKFWYKSDAASSNCKKTISVLKYNGSTLVSSTNAINFPVTTSYQQKTIANVSIDVESGDKLKIGITNTGDGKIFLDDFTVTRIP